MGQKDPDITETWTPEHFQKQRACCPRKANGEVSFTTK